MTFQSAPGPSTGRSEAALSACMERLGGVTAGTDKHWDTGVSGGYKSQTRSERPRLVGRPVAGPRPGQVQDVPRSRQ